MTPAAVSRLPFDRANPVRSSSRNGGSRSSCRPTRARTGFRLRMGFDRRWTSDLMSDDASGRAIFGVGVAAAMSPWVHVRREARRLFESVAAFRSNYPRATAHAVVGAAELLAVDERCSSARSLVEDGLASLPRGTGDERWPWPEPRLAYGNALLPEALIATGDALGDGGRARPRAAAAAVAGRRGDVGRALERHARGRSRTRRRASGVRSAADRSGSARRRLRTCVRRDGRPRLARRAPRVRRMVRGTNDVGVPMFDADDGRRPSTGSSRRA